MLLFDLIELLNWMFAVYDTFKELTILIFPSMYTIEVIMYYIFKYICLLSKDKCMGRALGKEMTITEVIQI